MVGVDCRNYKADDFHTTMDEINNISTDTEDYEDSKMSDDKTLRCSSRIFFDTDVFSGKNIKATIV